MRGKILFLIGLFSCLFSLRIKNLSIVTIPVMLLLLICWYDFIKTKKIRVNILSFYYSIYFISIMSTLNYSVEFLIYNLKNSLTVNTIIFILLNTIYIENKQDKDQFLNGLKIGIFLNLFYGTLEWISWIKFKFMLNQYIFGELLKVDSGGHLWTNINYVDNTIRVTGFSWDPLTIGMLSSIGVLLYKNKWLKIYSFLILFLSQSRSGLLALILTLGWVLLKKILKKEKREKKILRAIFYMFGTVFTVILIALILTIRGTNNSTGDKRRVAYYTSALKMTVQKNLITFLFGGGPNSTGTILASDENIAKETYLEEEMKKGVYWQVESDWAGILIGRGWIGLMAYIIIFFYAHLIEKDNKVKELIILFFFLGIGYYYEKSLIINMILILTCSKKNIKKWSKEEILC